MKNNKKGLTAIILGIVAIVGSLTAIISIQSKGTYAAGTYTITFRGAEDYELCGGLTCTTGPDGKIASCTGTYSGICNSWATSKCKIGSSGKCASPSGQTLAITSNNIPNHVYTSNVTYYCLAGSSLANKNCGSPSSSSKPSSLSKPSSSSSKPSSSSSTKPSSSSSVPSSSTPSSSQPDNPTTGVAAIYTVWAIGLGALVYSIVYFRRIMIK